MPCFHPEKRDLDRIADLQAAKKWDRLSLCFVPGGPMAWAMELSPRNIDQSGCVNHVLSVKIALGQLIIVFLLLWGSTTPSIDQAPDG